MDAQSPVLATERDPDSVICPVLTLPPEITSEIFSYYVLDPHLGRSGTYKPSRGPLTLAAVRQIWRHICFSTHSLWTSLRIYPNRSWVVDDFLHLLKCWLQRAGNYPLDLHVSGYERKETMSLKILSIISHHSSQLRTLTFSLHTPFSFPDDEIWGCLPLLTKLSVNILARDDTPVMMTAFRDAPRLREVKLSGASLQWISLPWIQLTHLEFCDGSIASCLQILKETPNLEVLGIFMPYLDRESLPLHHLALLRLHTLKFTHDAEGELLKRLVLPALNTIHLAGLQGPGLSWFIDLGVRSAWPLRFIRLSNMTVHSCTTCLRSLSSATQVEIRNFEFTGPDLNQLITLLHDNSVVPALQTLTLVDCGTEFSVRSLTEMIASRLSGAHDGLVKLRSFRLFSCWLSGSFVEEIWTGLRPAMDAGLEVHIK
ncbi:hypothetical protein B0H12DRAFT_47686 [Mycena haematopus]|nr:hypothetical protein B0H12DRAFT_47686 [Mycena haematopus]